MNIGYEHVALIVRHWLWERFGIPLPKKERDILREMAGDQVIYSSTEVIMRRSYTQGGTFAVIVVDKDGHTHARFSQNFPVDKLVTVFDLKSLQK